MLTVLVALCSRDSSCGEFCVRLFQQMSSQSAVTVLLLPSNLQWVSRSMEAETTIGKGAFSSCFPLHSGKVEKGISSLTKETFKDSTKMASIAIIENVSFAGTSPLSGCSVFKSTSSANSMTVINDPCVCGIQPCHIWDD